MELARRVAVVTGASSGIGAATARVLAGRGATVALLARTEQALERLAGELAAGGRAARPYPVDLADAGAVERAAAAIVADLGTPDVLVNNAGAGRYLFVAETSAAELADQMAVPFFAAFNVTRAFLPGMVARGSGRIVNVNSAASYLPFAGASGYTAARWAMRGFSGALRAELAGTGVGVTEIVAGKVRSEYFAHNPGAEERIPRIARIVPTLTPAQVGVAIARAVERDAREVRIPGALRLILAGHAIAPRLAEWLVAATGPRRPGS